MQINAATLDGRQDGPGTEPAPRTSVGDVIVRLLEHWGVRHAFGVISIHNMPILDPLAERGNIRFIPARGEAGALNMADAYARTTGGLGVGFTSTGTAAGNAAGAMVEALTAGSPVMHITDKSSLSISTSTGRISMKRRRNSTCCAPFRSARSASLRPTISSRR